MLQALGEADVVPAQAGAPLDNNVCERALKKAILHRKNALFYKTQNGARVGDLFMSLIYTCQLNQANPFDYLTQLQRHADQVAAQPGALDALELPRSVAERVERTNEGKRQRSRSMARRSTTRRGSRLSPSPPRNSARTLARRTKKELVDVLAGIGPGRPSGSPATHCPVGVAAAPDELVAATHQAIVDATDFDERDINRNFAYDYEAYAEVKRNLSRLIEAGQWRQAMDLSLELMKQGSCQVEMSDEGMMTEDIEDCLSVVIGACKRCDLPVVEILRWCTAMLDNDRVGFISRKPLEAPQKRLQTDAARR